MLGGKITVLNTCIRREKKERSIINDLKNLEKGEQSKLKAGRRKEIKLKAKNNIKQKLIELIKQKACSLIRINKIPKPLAGLSWRWR